jgi:hypothetical protein
MTKYPFIEPTGQPIVYIREVAEDELPNELRGSDTRVFALHDAEGNRLALAPNRRDAFALAKGNDMAPVSVH